MQEGLKLKTTKGEIVEVQGGRILRAIGRKDRHSKVCTAKGPRDRRVRLSATTAIQFYDVQDRLGCDRPSEAIDWLMKEAKAAIDDLGELPSIIPSDNQQPEQNLEEQPEAEFSISGHGIQSQEHLNEDPINSFSFILPSSSTEFVNSRTRSQSQSQSQDFCLSLQSSQDQMLLKHHLTAISSSEPALFSASSSLNFDATPTNWSNPPTMEIGRSRRMIGEGREGFVNDSFPAWQQKVLGQDQFFSQGGTLQSSYSPSFRAPMNPPLSDLNYDQMPAVSLSSATGNLFSGDGFSGFCASPRIQGEEEKHNPAPNKPSSASYPLHYQD